jgi:hypothetical protein
MWLCASKSTRSRRRSLGVKARASGSARRGPAAARALREGTLTLRATPRRSKET